MAFNKKLLVPAALSSQLDDAGRERIHMSPFPDTFEKTPYVPVVPFDSLFIISNNNNSALKADDINNNTFSPLDMGGLTGSGGFSIFSTNGVLINHRGAERDRINLLGDGVLWQTATGLTASGFVRESIYNLSEYLAIGPANNNVGVSSDALAWVYRTLPNTIKPQSGSVLFNGDVYVVRSSPEYSLLRSGDNFVADFETINPGGTSLQIQNIFTTATHIVAVALRTDAPVFDYRLFVSTTGNSGEWTERAVPVASLFTEQVSQFGFLPEIGRVVAAGALGNIFYSDDECATWETGPVLPVFGDADNNGVRAMSYSALNERLYYWRFAEDSGADERYDFVFSTGDALTWDINYQGDNDAYPVVDFCLHNFGT